MDSSSTRASLLSRVRDPGNDDAWREFVGRYQDLILRYALARGLQYCDAEDVRQAVLIRLSKALRDFKYSPERGRFRHYLGVAVRRAVADHVARPKSPAGAVSLDDGAAEPPDSDAGSDALWEREWVAHHYRRALRTVRTQVEPRSVEVFERLLAGRSVGEVAQEFAMTEAGVDKIRQRIRERLAHEVALQIREEDEPDA